MQAPSRFPQRRPPLREDSTRPSDRVAMGSVLVGALLVAAVLIARVGFASPVAKVNVDLLAEGGAVPHVASGHAAGIAEPTGAAVQPTVAPTATAAPVSDDRRQVEHTDGEGVVLR